MGFFNDIGRKSAEATSKIAKEGKLKLKINENKGKIKSLYEEIGRKVYEKHIREEEYSVKELLKEDLEKLDQLSSEIENARNEILVLNQKKICSNCHEEIPTNVAFCPKCGEKQEAVKSVKEEALEKLENEEISDDKKEEAEKVKQELQEEIEKKNEEN